ncbi:MAG TPA: hypothetical protein VMW47_01705 [Verrucomicrobiae bacterium]|nr:hypothetical protein [Verrucomicrobiae bacterium]
MPFLPVLGPIAFVVASLMVYWSGWTAVRILIPSVAVGMPRPYFYRRTRPITRSDIVYGLWMPAYLATIVVLSFVGGTDFGGRNLIPFPYDSLVFAVIALGFYYLGLWSGVRWTGTAVTEHVHPDPAPAAGAVPVAG